RGTEDRPADEREAEQIDEDGTGDERGVRGARIHREVAVPVRREIVDDIADAVLRRGLAPDEGLRPEPDHEGARDDDGAEADGGPVHGGEDADHNSSLAGRGT